MEKIKRQPISEVWDSMNYVMADSGYAERAIANGVVDACGGELPSLSFPDVLKNLRPYFLFDEIQGTGGLEDSYVKGKGISSNMIIQVTYEVSSDLTKRLNPEEESKLEDILDENLTYQEMEETVEIAGFEVPKVIAEFKGWSIPLITAKITYSADEHKESLEKVKKALLYSGLEKV